MNGMLEDIDVAEKMMFILDSLYGEGTKKQIEDMLVSMVEDQVESESDQALNDEAYTQQRHRVREALMKAGYLKYDGNFYQMIPEDISNISFEHVKKFLGEKKEPDKTQKEAEEKEVVSLKERFDLSGEEGREAFQTYLLKRIRQMDPFEFERLTTKVLRSCGLEFYPGNKTGDDGVDGYGYIEVAGLFKFKVLVQCKRYNENNKIANYAIRDLRGAVSTEAYKGLFVTTSSFTPRAKQEAEKFPQIDLMDGRRFVELMVKNRIGIVEKDGKFSLEENYLKHIELEETKDVSGTARIEFFKEK